MYDNEVINMKYIFIFFYININMKYVYMIF